FLGYPRYRAMRHLDQLDRWPDAARHNLAGLCAAAPARLARPLRLGQIGQMLAAPSNRPEQRYAGAIAFFGDGDKTAGYGEAMRHRLGHSAAERLGPAFLCAPKPGSGGNR